MPVVYERLYKNVLGCFDYYCFVYMLRLWIDAARPRTLPVSVGPVIVAAAYAWYFSVLHPVIVSVCVVFALLAQIASNFANDYFDYKKGADRSDRVGPRRAVASGDISPQKMLKAAIFTLFLACAIGSTLIYYGGWLLIIAGVLIALFALAYSAGPYPLAYHGLGDITVFIFFGLVAVILTYFIQAGEINYPIIGAGIAIGLLSVNVLLVNNYRDMEADKISGKRTTVVLFGRNWAKWTYLVNGIIAIGTTFFVWEKSFLFFIPLLYLIVHVSTWSKLVKRSGYELNPVLGMTARNLFIFTILISLSLCYAKWMGI